MSEARIQALQRMLEGRPDDPRARFGLAIELLNARRLEDAVVQLRRYLDLTEDEGNAWGRLASALADLGRPDEAHEALRSGIAAAARHGHPTMVEEFEERIADLVDVEGSE